MTAKYTSILNLGYLAMRALEGHARVVQHQYVGRTTQILDGVRHQDHGAPGKQPFPAHRFGWDGSPSAGFSV